MSRSLSITVEGIELRGRCGVTAEERAVGQTLVVDVALEPVACPGLHSDDLDGTVDYGRVVDIVRGVVEGGEFRLLERLATVIARRVVGRVRAGGARGGGRQDGAAGLDPGRSCPRHGRADGVNDLAKRAFLSLGSNLGDRLAALAAARDAIAALPGTAVQAVSSIYETEPQDREDQPPFLNQVVCVETALQPTDLLGECQRIEREHGRVRELRFGPRTLDIDILLFQDVESDDPELTLPHPRLVRRAFVLVPLEELWCWARGMPALDVPALAQATARDQAVRPYHVPEARSDER